MSQSSNKGSAGSSLTYHQLKRPQLEPVPPKSPHRKYLLLVAMQMLNTDNTELLCQTADCSERTFHYVKNRLREHDGVVLHHDRVGRRYFVIEPGVLDLAKVADLMRRLYPQRYAYIESLVERTWTPKVRVKTMQSAALVD